MVRHLVPLTLLLAACGTPTSSGGDDLTNVATTDGTSVTSDLLGADLVVVPDLLPPPDLSVTTTLDLVPSGDLAAPPGSDLTVLRDFAVVPDLLVLADLVPPADHVTVGDLSCNAGGSCLLTSNPCHAGVLSCPSGMPLCSDSGNNASDGTTCGSNQVCNAGACVFCIGTCIYNTVPCRAGCSTTTGKCVDGGPATNGASCGSNKVCFNGTCNSCTAGGACVPTNKCHRGQTICSTGMPTCMDTGASLGNGTTCDVKMVCNNGVCGACDDGAVCPLSSKCKIGIIRCGSGLPECRDENVNFMNGTSCGTDMVCNGGNCISCAAGQSCNTNINPCVVGVTDCGAGTLACVDSSTPVTPGMSCGFNKVCGGGMCNPCTPNMDCMPMADLCHVGLIGCTTGFPVCNATGNARSNGYICGSNQVCYMASCVGCTAGAGCVPTNPCHQGAISCASGQPACQDQGTNVGPGTSCGIDKVCNSSGMCIVCKADVDCTPANACKISLTQCTSGGLTCVMTNMNVLNNTPCGGSKTCQNGICT